MKKNEARNRIRLRRFSFYLQLSIVVLCLVFPAYAPEASNNAGAPARETKQKSATVAARKQSLSTLLVAAGQLLQVNDIRKAVQTLNEAGHLQLGLNLNKEALTTFQQSQGLLDENTDPVTTVDTLNGLASAYVAVADCPNARLVFEEARTISEQSNYTEGKAEALLGVSECQNQENHALALVTASAALGLWQSVGNNRGIMRSQLYIGRYQLARMSLGEATQAFEAAVDLAIELGDSRVKAESLVYLGYVEYRKGAWQELISFMTSAEKAMEGEEDPFRMGQITAGLAEAFTETGLPEIGLQKYHQALEYYRQANSVAGQIGMLWGTGKTHYLLGQYPEALTILQQTLADAELNHFPSWAAQSHDYLGRTYAAMNQHAQALDQFHRALDIWVNLGNPQHEGRVRALIGQLYQTTGKLNDASQFYQRALQLFDAIDGRVDRSATLFVMGQLEMQRGNYEIAENHLLQSIETTENVRSMSTTRDLTAAFSATVYDRYLYYIQCLMRRNDKQAAVQAFEVSESARARSLVGFLRGTERNLLVKLDSELAQQERSLRQLLRAKEDHRFVLLGEKGKQQEIAQLDAEIADLEKQYKALSATISKRYPSYDQLTRPRGWDLARIQEQVIGDDDTILLEYMLGVEKSYVWAVTRDSFTAHEITGDVGKAAETVYNLTKVRAKAGDENQLTQAAQVLSQMILSPVASHLNKRRIIVVADGVLNYIPFQMLPSPSSDSGPLVAQHEIINAPSASILGELRDEVAGRGTRAKVLAAFGNPAFGSGTQNDNDLQNALRDIELTGDKFDLATIGQLFYAEREVNDLREIATPAATFAVTGFAANRDQLFSMDLSQYAILHFATHGLLDPKRPEYSGLLLSTIDDQGKELKGFINLQDVYSLRAPVDLVVLSACRTGLGKEIRGEGLVGLTRGFMYAGATTVVASLWKVDDEATAELMKRFYIEMLQNRKTPAEALRIAQNSIRQMPQWSAPHYWAGFTLQGEYQYVVNSERGWKRYATLFVIVILVIVLGSGAAWYRYRVRAASSAVK